MNFRILAVDPGYDRLGVAVLEKQNGKECVLFSCCVVTDKKEPHQKRLLDIGEGVRKVIADWSPKALAIETLFLVTNHKTAMKVAEARGVILYEATKAGLDVHEYTPLQVKIAVTGYGRSDKKQVTEMVKRLVSLPLPLPSSKEGEVKRLDDEYDAIAVGLTCLAHRNSV